MTHEEAREFVERWKQAGPALEKVRRQELRDLVYAEHSEQIDGLIAVGLLHSIPSATSGLIEMQRIFSKARP